MSQGGKFLPGHCAFRTLAKMIRATDGEDDTTQYICSRLFAAEKEQLVLVRGIMKLKSGATCEERRMSMLDRTQLDYPRFTNQ